jgi:hypothetical protein
MRYFTKPFAIAAILIASLPAYAAQDQAATKYPNLFAYKFEWVRHLGGRPYFQCDFTSQICLDGVGWNGTNIFAGVILDAKDRKTVIRRIVCWEDFRDCNDYDAGVISYNVPTRSNTMTVPDMPMWCVEAMRARGEKCRGYDQCYKGWECAYSTDPSAPQPSPPPG